MAPERPGLGRDDSYNRVTLTSDMKSQICNMIADSSESLPLASVAEDESTESLPQTADQNHAAASTNNGANPASRLSESMQSSDFATPTPEKPNPLEQVATEPIGTNASRQTTLSQTPSVASGKKEGHDGSLRPGMMKRMSTAIKRQVSKNQ